MATGFAKKPELKPRISVNFDAISNDTSLDTSLHISNQAKWVYLQSISYNISISDSYFFRQIIFLFLVIILIQQRKNKKK